MDMAMIWLYAFYTTFLVATAGMVYAFVICGHKSRLCYLIACVPFGIVLVASPAFW